MTTLQDTKTIDRLLRKTRGDRHQTTVADELGVSRNSYKQWETGHSTPEVGLWGEILADYLGYSIEDMVWILYVSRKAQIERENLSFRLVGQTAYRPILVAA